jgi:isocitrate/isopropylmalate dehydrogenase
MALRFRIAVFDRDSIGPEIMQPTTEILGLLADRSG